MAFKPEETDRLDAFFYKKLHDKSELLARWQFRLLLCLAHGQADVERGFSVNKDMLVENMKTETFVAQRMVYDSVSSLGCAVIEVPITKSHRTSARAGKKAGFHACEIELPQIDSQLRRKLRWNSWIKFSLIYKPNTSSKIIGHIQFLIVLFMNIMSQVIKKYHVYDGRLLCFSNLDHVSSKYIII
ncbi:hypothetical protein LSH36_737g05010 [Paralvinella palmiformis]|uniref:Uncharacterized protein n=1 Tax=Paralvinella palmiformis TaxID=53620 RepID=A0AAD9MVP0_9ANNE|nr:hypothetical protein LSH36_737g05010 [Paralvinella palmiformis]